MNSEAPASEVPRIFRTGPQLELGRTGKEGSWQDRGGISPRSTRTRSSAWSWTARRPIAHVAREVGIHDTTLGNWVKDYRRRRNGDAAAGGTGGGNKTARELELERENRKLREENAFLVKAAAFFAKDHR
jgi:transposase